MKNMDESITHPAGRAAAFDLPGWKVGASAIAGILVGLLFVIAGVWKITDPFGAAARLAQARVPVQLSLLAAALLGVSETWAGVLTVVPRFRRWGAILTGLLLIAFLIYIGIYYGELRGEECNCFPWVKRAVGPAFFIGDAIMLAFAVIAGWWARPSASRRGAALVLAAIAVFAAVSFGIHARLQAGTKAPHAVQVDGKPFLLDRGRVLVFFFDPECTSCLAAGRTMKTFAWNDVQMLGVAITQPQMAPYFMADEGTGLKAPVTSDTKLLEKTFSFKSQPYAVALVNGRQKAAISDFDPGRLSKELRNLGFIK